MLITISRITVLVLGLMLCALGLWGFYAPQQLLGTVKRVMDAQWGILFAVIIRLMLGVTLLILAPASRFPSAFVIIGWIAIAAAVSVVLMGRERLRKFVNWWLERFSPAVVRIGLLFALAFGGFLIYGSS
jgi:uncharacterized membrane protein HdeD (DUF308 family)